MYKHVKTDRNRVAQQTINTKMMMNTNKTQTVRLRKAASEYVDLSSSLDSLEVAERQNCWYLVARFALPAQTYTVYYIRVA